MTSKTLQPLTPVVEMDAVEFVMWKSNNYFQSFGPDATVNSITKLQQKSIINPGLALLGKSERCREMIFKILI